MKIPVTPRTLTPTQPADSRAMLREFLGLNPVATLDPVATMDAISPAGQPADNPPPPEPGAVPLVERLETSAAALLARLSSLDDRLRKIGQDQSSGIAPEKPRGLNVCLGDTHTMLDNAHNAPSSIEAYLGFD